MSQAGIDAMAKLGIKPMSKTMTADTHDATKENTGRTFQHMGNTRTLEPLRYSDACVAHTVRMLTRNDWHHEAIVCMARDRILCLIEEVAALKEEIEGLHQDAAGASL
jgi:hypothetical protein